VDTERHAILVAVMWVCLRGLLFPPYYGTLLPQLSLWSKQSFEVWLAPNQSTWRCFLCNYSLFRLKVCAIIM